jgi:hypothetical protein
MPSSATQHLVTRLMNVWIADLKFVLDQLQELDANDPTGRFKGKFDMRKVGIAGHSLGGAQPRNSVTTIRVAPQELISTACPLEMSFRMGSIDLFSSS